MTRVEGLSRRNHQCARGRRHRRRAARHDQRPARRTASRSAPSAITPNMPASSTRSARPRGKNVNDGHRTGGRIALRLEPIAGISITPRIVYQEIRANGFNRQEVFNLYANPFTNPPRDLRRARSNICCCARISRTTPCSPTSPPASTSADVDAHLGHDLYQPRHPRQPRRQRADRQRLGRSRLPGRGVLLPSNLVDTTDLETLTQEVRLASSSDGPFQWLLGAFYSDVDRVYRQRLPTPGYDAFTDARLGAGTSAAVANGFPLNSPYNSDLPYDIKQKAIFGEASYDINGRCTATAGGRYYDFKEDAQLQVGRPLLQRRQPDRPDQVRRLQPALHPELGSRPTMSASTPRLRRASGLAASTIRSTCRSARPRTGRLFGGFQAYDDETLWNYELGVRAAAAGQLLAPPPSTPTSATCRSRSTPAPARRASCSTCPRRIRMGVEFELSARARPGPRSSRSPAA